MLLHAPTPDQLATVHLQRLASKLTQRQAAALFELLPKTISALESNPLRRGVGSL